MKIIMQTYHIILIVLALGIIAGLGFVSCQNRTLKNAAPESFVQHPGWAEDAVIYEVNVRQFTPEGTFNAFAEHLPRLKELGVDILWFMPVHPIGEENRKGKLGSYYSVQDYVGINPEFGTLDDFRSLVSQAHEMGMYVLLDWVANHTAWDHAWIEEHPDWYAKNEAGEIYAPFDWTDVAKLDFSNAEMRKAMTAAMKYWIEEADIDGYRCDVAAEVPTDFWNETRKALDALKPVFMLAEAEKPEHHIHAFDMSYAWELHHIMNEVAKGEKNATDIMAYFARQDTLYPHDAYRMNFITNHDENSWNGTAFERLGDAVETMAVLTYTLPGMPLIYSGQEAGLDKRLRFFEKDTIDWSNQPYRNFYAKLGQLRKENKALWSGLAGGKLNWINNSGNGSVLAFTRNNGENTVMVFANLTPAEQSFDLQDNAVNGKWINYFGENTIALENSDNYTLNGYGYVVLRSID